MTGLYGFNNTYGIAVTKETAQRYHLKTYADLASVSSRMSFGAEYDYYERDDGYDAMVKANDFHFKKSIDLDIGLKYQALNQGQIDVMVIFTTDGQLSASDAVVLEDDLHFYPSDLCGNVIRNEVLESHPELKEVFDKLTGKISDSDMARMNYEVETEAESRGMCRRFPAGTESFAVRRLRV